MTRDGLLTEPPPEPDTAQCLLCRRTTTAPVEVHPGRVTCPDHILDALTPRDP
ncbi:hypothetical protein ABZ714_17585 [Streptomyces sp. NPDC006798]|uniref:hypothetical protein n=1 Tax=Streptomyces sp. NPDC006798 TaxID=3155462 RepID=UPI0033FBF39D